MDSVPTDHRHMGLFEPNSLTEKHKAMMDKHGSSYEKEDLLSVPYIAPAY